MHHLLKSKNPTQKRFTKLGKALQEIADRVEQAISDVCLSENRIFETIEFGDGWAEIQMSSNGAIKVTVLHYDNDHESPVLESTIASILPDWWSIQARAEEEEIKEREFQDYLFSNCRYW